MRLHRSHSKTEAYSYFRVTQAFYTMEVDSCSIRFCKSCYLYRNACRVANLSRGLFIHRNLPDFIFCRRRSSLLSGNTLSQGTALYRSTGIVVTSLAKSLIGSQVDIQMLRDLRTCRIIGRLQALPGILIFWPPK